MILESIKGGCIAIFSIILLSGCSFTLSATKTDNLPGNSTILIMPPHDVVQRGLPHPVGIGSGNHLQKAIQRELNLLSTCKVVIFEPNDTINHTTRIKKEDAIAESKKLGIDYCLLLTLGEFRNAAPMTFRSDYVFLESGILIDVNLKKEVWSLDKPFRIDKANIGNHLELIDDIAKSVAESVIVN